MINNLYKIATEENDYATQKYKLKWFIDEQVEEEENAQTLIDNLKMIDNNSLQSFMLDKDLATRTYVKQLISSKA